jgi:hypothetical protein
MPTLEFTILTALAQLGMKQLWALWLLCLGGFARADKLTFINMNKYKASSTAYNPLLEQ